jgi:lipopolysaccharide biosynthesis protein
MFWAKTKAIRPIASLGLRYEDFPEERGQLDGTLAHAIERILFYVCELAGYSWLQTVTPTIHGESTKIDEASLAKKRYELIIQNTSF